MNETLKHLLHRRSVPAANLMEPAPSTDELNSIFTIATRVPDHGKLAPWRFIVFKGESRRIAGKKLLSLLIDRDIQLDDQQKTLELDRLTRAPMVIGVVSRAEKHPKIPIWEQQLSAGAVCLNILHAVHALGYSGQWLSEWYMFDQQAGNILGLNQNERFAGFIHIGTPEITPTERPRPEVDSLVTYWKEN